LHFGDIDPATGSAVQPTLVGISKVIDGLLGHDINSLKRISRFWLDVDKDLDVSKALVVTGDLTTVGDFVQYVKADKYLNGQLDLRELVPNIGPLGLGVADWRKRGIPGNHDHYPGHFRPTTLMFGSPPEQMKQGFLLHYPDTSTFQLKSGHTLKFLLIDTDADVWTTGINRFWARGRFHSQLEKLAKDLGLGTPAEREIRVLCLHHSPAHTKFELGIDERSRNALNDFIVQYNIAVLLTGHKHSPPIIGTFPAKHLNISRTYLEARCGSTSQQSTLSYSARTLTGGRPQRPNQLPNSLLVHRLYLEDDEVIWKSKYYFELSTGFVEQSAFHSSPKIRDLKFADRFKVYPLAV
jgi:hypothetical protein